MQDLNKNLQKIKIRWLGLSIASTHSNGKVDLLLVQVTIIFLYLLFRVDVFVASDPIALSSLSSSPHYAAGGEYSLVLILDSLPTVVL